jgi:hypothetical protein
VRLGAVEMLTSGHDPSLQLLSVTILLFLYDLFAL